MQTFIIILVVVIVVIFALSILSDNRDGIKRARDNNRRSRKTASGFREFIDESEKFNDEREKLERKAESKIINIKSGTKRAGAIIERARSRKPVNKDN